MNEETKNFKDRLFKFAVDTIKFLMTLPNRGEFDVFRNQLSKAATSMGANYEESQAAVSKRDFENKISICLKEAKESNYWYRVIKELNISNIDECNRLIRESLELSKIFGAIIVKSKSHC